MLKGFIKINVFPEEQKYLRLYDFLY